MSEKNQPISEEQLKDIANRARLELSAEHMNDFKTSFVKIVDMLDEINKVEVCKYKATSIPPVECQDLRKDEPVDQSVRKIEQSCHFYDAETHLFLTPKVLEED